MADDALHIKAEKQRAFLSRFRECGIVTRAAAAVGIARQTHYDWLEEDPDYLPLFEAAKAYASQALEEELYRRAIEEQSDTLLIFALKGSLPKKYRDNASVELTGKDGKPLYDVASMRAYMQSVEDET